MRKSKTAASVKAKSKSNAPKPAPKSVATAKVPPPDTKSVDDDEADTADRDGGSDDEDDMSFVLQYAKTQSAQQKHALLKAAAVGPTASKKVGPKGKRPNDGLPTAVEPSPDTKARELTTALMSSAAGDGVFTILPLVRLIAAYAAPRFRSLHEIVLGAAGNAVPPGAAAVGDFRPFTGYMQMCRFVERTRRTAANAAALETDTPAHEWEEAEFVLVPSFSETAIYKLAVAAAAIATAADGDDRRRGTLTQVVTTVDGGGPCAACVDPCQPHARVYFTDDSRVRRLVVATGQLTTLAGSVELGFADGRGAAAAFCYPRGMAVTRDGTTLYVCDNENNRLRRVDVNGGRVTTVAGTGEKWSSSGSGGAMEACVGMSDGFEFSSRKWTQHADHTAARKAAGGSAVELPTDGKAILRALEQPRHVAFHRFGRFGTAYGAADQPAFSTAEAADASDDDGDDAASRLMADTIMYITTPSAIRRYDVLSGDLTTVKHDAQLLRSPFGIECWRSSAGGGATGGELLLVSCLKRRTIFTVDIRTGATAALLASAPALTSPFAAPTGLALDGSECRLFVADSNAMRFVQLQ